MKKRTLVSVALALVFVLALAAPALAQTMDYSAEYVMDGTISQRLQAGHLCNTGAELKQTIVGTGTLTKVMDIAQVQGRITVADANDFVTAADAVRNLTVTSVIELCSPPKMVYEDAETELEGVVHPAAWYGVDGEGRPAYWNGGDDWVGNTDTWEDEIDDEVISIVNKSDRQIWAAQVEAYPGYSGNLHQQFEAAYGPFEGRNLVSFAADGDDYDLDDSMRWAWEDTGFADVLVGDDYVGNYFGIGQLARTSMGKVDRYIDLSSMWSHGFLYEDMSVTGFAEVSETFTMGNLPKGADMEVVWWELF